MTKKHIIALADTIREGNKIGRNDGTPVFDSLVISELAWFCHAQNSEFNRARWLDYIDGKCGKNGGKI